MKYSVRGTLNTADGTPIVAAINKYVLWRLVTEHSATEFVFEAWVNAETDKATLFNELKPYVDTHGGVIDWHVCSHDEITSAPCIIAEEYRGE
ncbi:hypothetical protein BK120_08290 [Paenibacillus sp. FSL A5-0031]|uniref:hypothetical protein n=1 Tax=Paenibacillus sp. FSL A5-0031 TaxID=1920420 RepID=UPI00096F3D7B|nr:hypothetical protein [Paenibacillus sp. FSL A5-0031]OME86912.1 hypothetical protein BK120_08290 [Paenibacillus sp. FSL A5-0031]